MQVSLRFGFPKDRIYKPLEMNRGTFGIGKKIGGLWIVPGDLTDLENTSFGKQRQLFLIAQKCGFCHLTNIKGLTHSSADVKMFFFPYGYI